MSGIDLKPENRKPYGRIWKGGIPGPAGRPGKNGIKGDKGDIGY